MSSCVTKPPSPGISPWWPTEWRKQIGQDHKLASKCLRLPERGWGVNGRPRQHSSQDRDKSLPTAIFLLTDNPPKQPRPPVTGRSQRSFFCKTHSGLRDKTYFYTDKYNKTICGASRTICGNKPNNLSSFYSKFYLLHPRTFNMTFALLEKRQLFP